MFEQTHKHHTFTKISKVYEEHVLKLRAELDVLTKQLTNLRTIES